MSESTLQILSLVLTNFGIILWFRKESREDWVRCQNTLDAIQKDSYDFKQAMREETKDFHERLLEIENKKGGKYE